MQEIATDIAEIDTLPPDCAGKIRSARSVVLVRAFTVISPLLLVVSLGMLLWATAMLNGDAGEDQHRRFAVATGLYAGATFFISLILAFARPNYWLKWVARREIASRPDRVLDPGAPGVHFVGVVPKSNWENTTLADKAADIGFLAVDFKKGVLFFEGDNLRYRIPSSAIVKCELDSYTRIETRDDSSNKVRYFHLVLVTVRISAGTTVELPFRIRQRMALFSDQKQRIAHYELLREVNHLKGKVGGGPFPGF